MECFWMFWKVRKELRGFLLLLSICKPKSLLTCCDPSNSSVGAYKKSVQTQSLCRSAKAHVAPRLPSSGDRKSHARRYLSWTGLTTPNCPSARSEYVSQLLKWFSLKGWFYSYQLIYSRLPPSDCFEVELLSGPDPHCKAEIRSPPPSVGPKAETPPRCELDIKLPRTFFFEQFIFKQFFPHNRVSRLQTRKAPVYLLFEWTAKKMRSTTLVAPNKPS